MKQCLSCKIELPDSHSFCKFCGGPISQLSATGNRGSLSCAACSAEVKSDWRFCKQCGQDLLAAAVSLTRVAKSDRKPFVVADSTVSQCGECGAPITEGLATCAVCGAVVRGPATLRASSRLRLILSASVTVVLLAVGGFAAYYFWFSNAAIEKELDAAITRGDLIKPVGASARDFYIQLKKNGVDENTLSRYQERLLPLLTMRPQKLLDDFIVPANKEPDLSQWQEALEPISWASELKPDDTALVARAKYIQGRVAFLNGQKDQALEIWKQATDLDKSWAVPPNSVGIIYNERKNWQTARPYFLDATRRDPTWAVPYSNLGTTYFMQSDYDRAWASYNEAIQRAPDWARPHAWLGDMAMQRKNYDLAVNEYQKVLDLAQSGSSSLDLDEVRRRLERAKKKSQEVGEGEFIEKDS